MKKSIRILNVYYEEAFIIANKYIIPIQAGRALNEKIPNMIGDDTGDNISHLNPYLCEFTAMYWEWKNSDSDYVGLMHYRRSLDFSTTKFVTDPKLGYYNYYSYPTNEAMRKVGLLSEDLIKNLVESCDILLPIPLQNNPNDCSNNYEQYCAYEDHY